MDVELIYFKNDMVVEIAINNPTISIYVPQQEEWFG